MSGACANNSPSNSSAEKRSCSRGTPMEHIISSTVGGVFVALLTTPLDVVKTRLQAQLQAAPAGAGAAVRAEQFSGTLDAFAKIAQNEGLHKLWRGLPPTLVMQVPATTLYFTVYEKMKLHSEWAGAATPMVAGLSARALTVLVTSPIDMFRTNLQSHTRNIGSLDILANIWKEGRVRQLWAGLLPTLYRDVPFSAIYWTAYEWLKHSQNSRGREGFLVNFASGALAGTVAACTTLPFDVVKTRIQMNVDVRSKELVDPVESRSVRSLVMQIWRQEGVTGLFTGIGPRVAKVAPACAIMIGTYEWMKNFFATRNLKHLKLAMSVATD